MSLMFAAGQPGLEPYACQQRWTLAQPFASGEWVELFSDYLGGLAHTCIEGGGDASSPRVVIGHIKLLALFGEGEYLRVSVVSPRHAATVTGGAPGDCSEMLITLNVLVYGLPTDRLAELTAAVAAAVALRWGAAVENVPLPHHHHHYEGSEHADQP